MKTENWINKKTICLRIPINKREREREREFFSDFKRNKIKKVEKVNTKIFQSTQPTNLTQNQSVKMYVKSFPRKYPNTVPNLTTLFDQLNQHEHFTRWMVLFEKIFFKFFRVPSDDEYKNKHKSINETQQQKTMT